MTYLTGEVTVIHTDTQVDFDNFVYSAVYFSTATGPITINGTAVSGTIGETLEVVVDGGTTTPIAGILFLGNPIAPQAEIKTGLITGDTITETWQFVNIKTGNPVTHTTKL